MVLFKPFSMADDGEMAKFVSNLLLGGCILIKIWLKSGLDERIITKL
jgi:hypothetical protein